MVLRRFMQHVKEQNWFAFWLAISVVILIVFHIDLKANDMHSASVLNEWQKKVETHPEEVVEVLGQEIGKGIFPERELLEARLIVADAEISLGNFDKALQDALQINMEARLSDFRYIEAKAQYVISDAHFKKGLFSDARHQANQAFLIFESLGNEAMAAKSLMTIGSTYAQVGEYEEALSYYARAYKIMQRIEDYGGLHYLSNNIGAVYYWCVPSATMVPIDLIH